MQARFFVKLLFVGVLGLIAGCTSNTAAPPPEENATPKFDAEYRIGVGDTLNVNVWRNPDLSVSVPVRPDGKISVPLADDVMVGNKTPEEVAEIIKERLSTFIRDPYVTVIVSSMGSTDFRSRVRVTGAVNNPLSQPYRQGMTVLDMVLDAGGVNTFANPGKTTLYRRDGQMLEIDLDDILEKGNMSTNYQLKPGDVVTVPQRAF
jgi:polysaccharide export outer membrane protein